MAYQNDRIKQIPAPLPVDYDRQTNFTDYQTANPGQPMSGAALDAEFNVIEQALDETQARQRLIQRDDGALQNKIVTRDSLAEEVIAGVNSPTTWTVSTVYAETDSVIVYNEPGQVDPAWYVCEVGHTAVDFAADLAAGRWRLLVDLSALLADAGQTVVVSGTGSETFTDALNNRWIGKYTTDQLAGVSSAQVGDKARTPGYSFEGDGGANDFICEEQDGSPEDGGSIIFITGTTRQWRALFPNGVNARQFGAPLNGVDDDQPAIAAMGAYTEVSEVSIPFGAVFLSSDAAISPSLKLNVGNNVTFSGPGNITGLGVADQSIVSKTDGWSATLDSEGGSWFGRFISHRKSGTATAASETDAFLAIITNDQDSDTFLADVVGVGGRAYIPGTNPNGRGWGMNAYARIAPGGDGLIHGIEVNLENGGTDNPTPDTAKAKYGVNFTTKPGSNPGTAAIKIGSDSEWHYGMWAAQSSFVSDTSSYIALSGLFNVDAQGRIATGTQDNQEQLRVKKTTGRSQVFIESDGAGGEASTRYTDSGTRNWTAGHWFDTGRYSISTASNLASSKVFEIDGNGNFGFNGFSLGGGQGVIFIANATTVPTTNPTGGGIFYFENGVPKCRSESGIVYTMTPE